MTLSRGARAVFDFAKYTQTLCPFTGKKLGMVTAFTVASAAEEHTPKA